jgi:hypothetical protein
MRRPHWLWLHTQRKKVKSNLDKIILVRRAETIWHGSAFSGLVPFVIKWTLQDELFREYLMLIHRALDLLKMERV